MSALDKILFSKIETPIEIAIYQLWLISNKPTDESDTMFVVAQNAAAELAALRARVEAAERERDELREALEKISEFDAESRLGYLDEWEEAWAFGECKKIAAAALAAKGAG